LEKQITPLELDKILKLLSERCVNAEARSMALSLRPDGSYVACRELLAQTGDAFTVSTKCGRPYFDGLSVPEDALRRAAAGGCLSMGELLAIAHSARTVRLLVNYRKAADMSLDALDRFFEALMPCRPLEDAIFDAILSEDTVADHASPELATIRRKLRAAQDSVRDRLNSVVNSSAYAKFLQEQLVTMREGRYVVPVRADQKNNVPGLVHGVSASGQTLFIEPLAVVEANNEIRLLEGKEAAEIERILQRLSGLCGEHAGGLLQSCRAAVQLEVIFAKSELGIAMNAYLPQFGDDGIIDLKRARHPLIDAKKVVPIDLRLGADYDCLVITGPNTGGKTVALKTAGLFCMMAACGLMLPTADGSRVSWFDRVLADIGDEQSIEQSLSTFSAHTTNIVSILEQTNDRSLVLFDELGAGTDPAEGAALAISILESVRAQGAKVIATTHYAELKLYAIDTDRVVNASCEFDLKTLRPTYRLLIGVAGSSNAFAICKRLGVSQAIIDRAKELMNSKTVQLDNVMRRLEKERQHLEKQNAQQKALVDEARRQKEESEQQMKAERAEFERELAKQRTEN
ncbi:MAG: endonuclease MutS2, partial [Clostridia bacterium]|nr:endonuclease MutS2 [Clostridia bacterium]